MDTNRLTEPLYAVSTYAMFSGIPVQEFLSVISSAGDDRLWRTTIMPKTFVGSAPIMSYQAGEIVFEVVDQV